MYPNRFKNRADAAQKLSEKLEKYKRSNSIVLGIPRGGIVTASVIAKALSLPMGIIVVRKIGHPGNPEYAIAGVSESGSIIQDDEVKNIDQVWFKQEVQAQFQEARRRRSKYWGRRPPLGLKGKIAILVDDGLATGLTMEIAIKELKSKDPAKIIVAVPVSPRDTANKIRDEVDEFISLIIPPFYAGSVGSYYEKFTQVDDDEVIQILSSINS